MLRSKLMIGLLGLIASIAVTLPSAPASASPAEAAASEHSVATKQVAKKAGGFSCYGKWYSGTSVAERFGGGQFRYRMGAASYNDRAVIVESMDGRAANFWVTDKVLGGAFIGVGPSWGTSLCLPIRANSDGADVSAARGGQRWNSGFWLI